MSLRFFADHCVSNFIIQFLRNSGYEVLRLKDHLTTDSPDQVVISKSQQLDAILISLDGDFADVITFPPTDYKGIVALQVRNHPEIVLQLMTRLKNYLSNYPEMECYKGLLLVVEVHRIRVVK